MIGKIVLAGTMLLGGAWMAAEAAISGAFDDLANMGMDVLGPAGPAPPATAPAPQPRPAPVQPPAVFAIPPDAGVHKLLRQDVLGTPVRPANLTVPAGWTVQWRNYDIETHTIQLYKADECHPGSLPAGIRSGLVHVPEHGESGCWYEPVVFTMVEPHAVFSHRMADAGRYGWECLIHAWVRGDLEVRE